MLGARLRIQGLPLGGDRALRLWLVGEQVDLHARCHELTETDRAPFWAFCWASGQALARFVLGQPEWVRGKHVVDFGAGSGVAGIAAALAGARRVTAVDIDPAAREACEVNAALNGVTLETAAELPTECDLILAADVLYDEGSELLAMLRARGTALLLSDPGRASSPDLPEPALATYELTTLPDVDPPMRRAAVYALLQPTPGTGAASPTAQKPLASKASS